MSDFVPQIVSFAGGAISTVMPFIWGMIGGAVIEIVDFYLKIKEEEEDYEEAVIRFRKKYCLRILISALIGGIVVYSISLTQQAPIWQIIVGMSAMGLVTHFVNRKT